MEILYIVGAILVLALIIKEVKDKEDKPSRPKQPAWFVSADYYAANPDVKAAGVDAWVHYTQTWQIEGYRKPYGGRNPRDGGAEPSKPDVPSLDRSVEGAAIDRIIESAKKYGPANKLNYWVFGGISTLAEALRRDPSIAPNLRVYFIASWNRSHADPEAWAYIRDNFKNKVELYRDESYNRPFYGGGNQGFLRAFEKAMFNTPVVGKVWKSYPLEYESGERRTRIKAGDYPLYLYTTRSDLKAKVFKSDGGKFKVSRKEDKYLMEDGLRRSVYDEIKAGFKGWTATDGTAGIPLIIDSDIGLRGQRSDKDDQQALIFLRGLLKKFKVEAFVGTSSYNASGKKAFDQLFDELGTSDHLKALTYQGNRKPFVYGDNDRKLYTRADYEGKAMNVEYGGDPHGFPVTSQLTRASISANKTILDHTKKGVWKGEKLPDGATVNANIHLIFIEDGRVISYPFEHLRSNGQTSKVVGWKNIDSQSRGRHSPRLKKGDVIGIMVSTQVRVGTAANGEERSAIKWITCD